MQLESFSMSVKDERKLAMRRFCLDFPLHRDSMDEIVRWQDAQPPVDSSYALQRSL